MENSLKSAIDTSQLEWVFFDFDGTLRHNEPNGLNTFHEFVEEQGISLADTTRREAYRWNHEYWASSSMLKDDVRRAGDEREILYQRYTRRYLKQLGIEGGELDELALILHQQMSERYEPIDHVPEEVPRTLGALRDGGYYLALISNRSQSFSDKVVELGLSEHFEFTMAAGEVGSWKPDPELLQRAVERAGIQPAQTIYVGDNPYADVAGAQAAGIQPVLIDPEGLFPEIECPVISRLDELTLLLDE